MGKNIFEQGLNAIRNNPGTSTAVGAGIAGFLILGRMQGASIPESLIVTLPPPGASESAGRPIPAEVKGWMSEDAYIDMANRILTKRGLNGNILSFMEVTASRGHPLEQVKPIPNDNAHFVTRAGDLGLRMRATPSLEEEDVYKPRVTAREKIVLAGHAKTIPGRDGEFTLFGLDVSPFVATISGEKPLDDPDVFVSPTNTPQVVQMIYYNLGNHLPDGTWDWNINPHPSVDEDGSLDWNTPVLEPEEPASLGK